MSEKPKSKAKQVVYRKRHKLLGHLTANVTKHAFKQRLHGALQRQESEPVYFGVSVMSAQEHHAELEIFEKVTQNNYQEAAKQCATRTRLTSLRHQGHRQGRPEQSRSPEHSRQVDRLHGMHPRECTRADCLPGGCTPAQGSPNDTQREGLPDPQPTHSLPIPSQLNPLMVPDARQCFPTPSVTNPHTPLSFAFEVPAFHRIDSSMAFTEDNGISGLGSNSINQSFHQPQRIHDFQQTSGQFHPYPNIHEAGPSTHPFYDLPTEGYNQNFEFSLTNNLTDPNLWFTR